MKTLKDYAEFMQCHPDVTTWIDNVLSKQEVTQQEAEHIIDYLASDKRPKRISRMSFEQAKDKAGKWVKSMNKKASHIKETEADIEVVLDLSDGFKFVRLVGENAYKREGFLMRHCVESYYGKEDEIYSLRDKNNEPHCTVSKQSEQIKGKGNGCINPKYIKYVVEFLNYLDIDVRDSEMLNLGYINVEEYGNILHDDTLKNLFNGKYHYIEKDMIDSCGDVYQPLSLLDNISLIKNNKIRFDIKNFVDTELSHSRNVSSGDHSQKASSGDSLQNASSGGYSQNASSGNDSQNASSGNYSKNASSGNYSQNASSGYGSQNASSGNYSQNVSSGNHSKNVSSGNHSRNTSSGYESQIEMTGLHNVGAAIGVNSKIKGIKGNWICLAEYDEDGICVCIKSAKIDGKKIKENTWYKLENKKFVEIES